MLKRDELANENSCLNRAAEDEPVFVLRAKDAAAPDIIRLWINQRVALGLNEYRDDKLKEALQLADSMERWRYAHPKQS